MGENPPIYPPCEARIEIEVSPRKIWESSYDLLKKINSPHEYNWRRDEATESIMAHWNNLN